MALVPNSATLGWNDTGAMPRIKLPDGRVIVQPHTEWFYHQLRWRWLLDSWEGGEAYRMAIYGWDLNGLPIRNLIRHKREYPSIDQKTYSISSGRPPGSDSYAQATDDDYELRRARTPVPGFLAEVVEKHIGKIFSKEIMRTGPDEITAWWDDVDGKGTTIDQWMAETVAPLLLVLGQIDIILDHPPVPAAETVNSRADEIRLGLDSVVASYILPENVLWWSLDAQGCYEEVLIREQQDNHGVLWRYWNKEFWCLYDVSGEMVDSEYRPNGYDENGQPLGVINRKQPAAVMKGDLVYHGYGMVPIRRIFDRRRPRCRNVGLPRYEMIADLQREYYNRDSELILSDTTQAHPLLQGPEDYVSPDGTIPVGPSWLLPMKKNVGAGATSYQGFTTIDFPKDGAASLRLNKQDIRDAVDRLAALTKPAGAQGSSGQTVSQSGVSKQLDAVTGHDLLGNITKSLQHAENEIVKLYWIVFGNGTIDEASLEKTIVQYPAQFSLMSADDLAAAIIEWQAIMSTATGELPETEQQLYSALIRLMLPGLDDDDYDVMDKEIQDYLKEKGADAEAAREAPVIAGMVGPDGIAMPESDVAASNGAAATPSPETPAAAQEAISVLPEAGKTRETLNLKGQAAAG